MERVRRPKRDDNLADKRANANKSRSRLISVEFTKLRTADFHLWLDLSGILLASAICLLSLDGLDHNLRILLPMYEVAVFLFIFFRPGLIKFSQV